MAIFFLIGFLVLLLLTLLAVISAFVWSKRLQNQLKAYGHRLAQIETILDERLTQQKAEVEALVNESVEQKDVESRGAQQNEMALLTEKVGAIEATGIERIQAFTAQVEDQLKALEDQITSRPDVDALNSRCHPLAQRIVKLDEALSRLTASVNDSQQRAAEAAAELRREVQSKIGKLIGDNEKLQRQIKEAIGDDLKNAFRTLDNTLTSVLGEMRSDLLRGVNRIDDLQAVGQAERKENETAG